MMGNISDVYYLLQLILPEVYVYIHDSILREFPWPNESNVDDMDNLESKTRNNIPKHISSDLITLPFICVLLFIILIILEKFFKNDSNHYASATNISIPNDLPMVYANTRITDPLHSCGDTFFSQEILQPSNPLQSMCVKSQQSKNLNLPGSSITKVHSEHLQHSQSTQTSLRILSKATKSQEWVVRRTRSGQIYGKYPV
ncbi:hypothetical protein HZH66_006455 [Vespula vulgaris]|uniref:Uncharacterized protein n=2 Tax=Vespula vulgaris TaxID=7454 RepID=A0A834K1J3_VESVU|nr:hypothetical protein HZH66_006455 [Vespula vulgaris]